MYFSNMQHSYRHMIYLYCAILFIFTIFISVSAEKISDQRMCADRACETLISKARALARHRPTDPAFLAFERGDVINVYSKSAGNRQDLWGGELNGKKGYFPRSFVREYKVEIPNPQYVMETEDHIPFADKVMGRVPADQKNNEAPSNAKETQTGPGATSTEDPAPPVAGKVETRENTDKKAETDPSVSQQSEVKEQQSSEVDDTEIDETEIDETEIEETEEPVENEDGFPDDSKIGEKEKVIESDQNQVEDTEVDETEIGDETEISENDTEESEEETEDETNLDSTETADTQDTNKQMLEAEKLTDSPSSADKDVGIDDNVKEADNVKEVDNMKEADNVKEVVGETDDTDIEEETAKATKEDGGSLFGSMFNDGSNGRGVETQLSREERVKLLEPNNHMMENSDRKVNDFVDELVSDTLPIDKHSDTDQRLQYSIDKHSDKDQRLHDSIDKHSDKDQGLRDSIDKHSDKDQGLHDSIDKHSDKDQRLQDSINKHSDKDQGLHDSIDKHSDKDQSLQDSIDKHSDKDHRLHDSRKDDGESDQYRNSDVDIDLEKSHKAVDKSVDSATKEMGTIEGNKEINKISETNQDDIHTADGSINDHSMTVGLDTLVSNTESVDNGNEKLTVKETDDQSNFIKEVPMQDSSEDVLKTVDDTDNKNINRLPVENEDKNLVLESKDKTPEVFDALKDISDRIKSEINSMTYQNEDEGYETDKEFDKAKNQRFEEIADAKEVDNEQIINEINVNMREKQSMSDVQHNLNIVRDEDAERQDGNSGNDSGMNDSEALNDSVDNDTLENVTAEYTNLHGNEAVSIDNALSSGNNLIHDPSNIKPTAAHTDQSLLADDHKHSKPPLPSEYTHLHDSELDTAISQTPFLDGNIDINLSLKDLHSSQSTELESEVSSDVLKSSQPSLEVTSILKTNYENPNTVVISIGPTQTLAAKTPDKTDMLAASSDVTLVDGTVISFDDKFETPTNSYVFDHMSTNSPVEGIHKYEPLVGNHDVISSIPIKTHDLKMTSHTEFVQQNTQTEGHLPPVNEADSNIVQNASKGELDTHANMSNSELDNVAETTNDEKGNGGELDTHMNLSNSALENVGESIKGEKGTANIESHKHHGNLLSEILKEELDDDTLMDVAHETLAESNTDEVTAKLDNNRVDNSITKDIDTSNDSKVQTEEEAKYTENSEVVKDKADIPESKEFNRNTTTPGTMNESLADTDADKQLSGHDRTKTKSETTENEVDEMNETLLAVFGSSEGKKDEKENPEKGTEQQEELAETAGVQKQETATDEKSEKSESEDMSVTAQSGDQAETEILSDETTEHTETTQEDIEKPASESVDAVDVYKEKNGDVKDEIIEKDIDTKAEENVDKDTDLKFINDKGETVDDKIEYTINENKKQTDVEMEMKETEKVDDEIEIQEILNSYLPTGTDTQEQSDTSAESLLPSETNVEYSTDTIIADRTDTQSLLGEETEAVETRTTIDIQSTEDVKVEPTDTAVAMDTVTDNVQENTAVSSSTENLDSETSENTMQSVVIDGTTFMDDYFGVEETASPKAKETPKLQPTSTVIVEKSVTPVDEKIMPTSMYETYESTVIPIDEVTHIDEFKVTSVTDSQLPIDDGWNHNTNTAASSALPVVTKNLIQASETLKESSSSEKVENIDPVHILGTSFGFVSQSTGQTNSLPMDTDTQPMESVQVSMETQMIQNNETVESHNVQDQVQPSLDQEVYTTDVYLSRKPLSTGSTTESSADTISQGQEVNQGQGKHDVKQDLNNNDLKDENNNEKIMTHQQTTPESVPEYNTPPPAHVVDKTDPYSSDVLQSRKVPDPELDEEDKKAAVDIMKSLEPMLKAIVEMLPGSLQSILEQEPLGLSPSLTMLVSMVSTNVLALLTCLGCMCSGKKKPTKKDPLVVIRELEEKLFISTKEKENMEDELQEKTTQVEELRDEVNSQQSTTGTVETESKTIRLHNDSLKKQVVSLQQEVTDYKHEVLEKSQQLAYKDSQLHTYTSQVESLEQRALDAELALQKTSESLSEKGEEVRTAMSQVQSLSEHIQHLETRKQQLEDEAVDWSERVKDLSEQIEQSLAETKRMQEEMAFKENELEVLRDCFLQVKAFQGDDEMKEEPEETPDLAEKLKQMMDVSRVNASLRAVEEERDVIQNKLVIEVESRKESEEQIQQLKRKMETNQTDKMKAERQCQEAQTKLEVLSKYFKEKEAELTRQLGEQEVLKNQNISKLESSDSITVELSKENDTYRQQIEDLKTEISKAERDFRSQIAANEKKAHENWLATRAAEREVKESRHECGMLRQKLTDLERKLLQGPPPGLIRPITHRGMPPPGMLNGPLPPPPPDRPGSRGSVHGHVTPRLRDDDYRSSPVMAPPDRRMPPGPRPPPPHSAMSPPPFAIRPPFPGDRRSPPPFDRYPPPPMRGPRPPYPRPPPPPHLRSPPLGASSEHEDSRQDFLIDDEIRSCFPLQPTTSTPKRSRSGVNTTPKSGVTPTRQNSEPWERTGSAKKKISY